MCFLCVQGVPCSFSPTSSHVLVLDERNFKAQATACCVFAFLVTLRQLSVSSGFLHVNKPQI